MSKSKRPTAPAPSPEPAEPSPDLNYIAEDIRGSAVPIDSLVPDPKNARLHGEANRAATLSSMRSRGQTLPITVRLANRVVMTGNSTLDIAKELGWTHLAAVFLDYTEAEAAAWAIAHNHGATLATWDYRQLAETMAEFSEIDWVEDVKFDSSEFEAIMVAARDGLDDLDLLVQETPSTSLDEIPELPKDPVTKPGDIWILGKHRLICGSCRDPEVVARLLDGRKINVAFTSPPYASQRKYDETSGFKPIAPDDFVDWFDAVQANVREHLADDGSWFVNIKEHCEDGQRVLYVKDLTIAHVRRWGWRFVDEFCWRRASIPGRYPARFKNEFEPVFHMTHQTAIKFRPEAVAHASDRCVGKEAAKDRGYSDERAYDVSGNNQTTGMALPGNVLNIATVSEHIAHSAVFPVGLPTFFIKAYSDPGDAIFDPFMGSGTTIIACEREDRVGYGCEISPGYCDVTVSRWETATGLKAERVSA